MAPTVIVAMMKFYANGYLGSKFSYRSIRRASETGHIQKAVKICHNLSLKTHPNQQPSPIPWIFQGKFEIIGLRVICRSPGRTTKTDWKTIPPGLIYSRQDDSDVG